MCQIPWLSAEIQFLQLDCVIPPAFVFVAQWSWSCFPIYLRHLSWSVFLLYLQPRMRGRGWNRGNYPGNNTNNNPPIMGGPSRPPEEEWDPEYTPKSRKYFQVWLLALISDTRAPPPKLYAKNKNWWLVASHVTQTVSSCISAQFWDRISCMVANRRVSIYFSLV